MPTRTRPTSGSTMSTTRTKPRYTSMTNAIASSVLNTPSSEAQGMAKAREVFRTRTHVSYAYAPQPFPSCSRRVSHNSSHDVDHGNRSVIIDTGAKSFDKDSESLRDSSTHDRPCETERCSGRCTGDQQWKTGNRSETVTQSWKPSTCIASQRNSQR